MRPPLSWTLSGTVAGLAALFSFKTHVPGVYPRSAASSTAQRGRRCPPPPVAGTVSASASASRARVGEEGRARRASIVGPPRTAAGPPGPYRRPLPPKQGTVKLPPPPKAPADQGPRPSRSGHLYRPGLRTPRRTGEVQVQLTVANGKITAASDVQQAAGTRSARTRSSQLSSEVLTAQKRQHPGGQGRGP